MLGLFSVNEIYLKNSCQKFKLPVSSLGPASAATTVYLKFSFKVLLKASGSGKSSLLSASCSKWGLEKLNNLVE